MSMSSYIKHRMLQLLRRQEGLAYLEFAIALPFLATLLLGSIEATRYIIIAQKAEKASVTISDLVAQSGTIGTTSLNQLVLAAGQIMKPYSFNTNGFVVVSSVSKVGTNPPKVNWQYKSSSANGSWTQASMIGTTGGTATMPTGFTMVDKENVIVTEVFYDYRPMLTGSILQIKKLYKLSVFRPRLGELGTLGP